MTSKANIFSALPQHHSDSEDDDNTFTKNKTKKPTDKDNRPRQDNKNAPKTGNRPAGAGAVQKTDKEEHARHKEPRRDKGVSDQPHPLDRHSGAGNQAYGAKPKKSGAGKGNWGSYRDDKRPGENLEERQQGGEEGEAEVKPLEEEKPSLTLQEYYQQQNFGKSEPQVNEAKSKITSDQLMKEMGTATLLKGRHTQDVDDRKVGKKKDRLNADHHATINTEHANLLGFRTGFIEKEYRPRGEGESPAQPGGRGGQRGGPREPREQENAKEEETQAGTQAGTQAQTEGQEAQAGEKVAEGGQQAAGGQGDNQNRRGGRGGQGGQRGGGRGGNRPQGDRPQGDRPQGDRRPYGGKQNEPTKITVDDSAFPKLG